MTELCNQELLDFIKKSPTAFHAVAAMREMLLQNGYRQIYESERWELAPGGKYLAIRNGSSLIAWRVPRDGRRGFMIMASHSDSPTFKIKENPEMETEKIYVSLNVEKYGGMLCAPWFDRPLSVAGRLVVRTDGGFETKLVNVERDLLLIPNLAIHMNREANDGQKYNVQTDLLPLYGTAGAKGTFAGLVAGAAGVEPEIVAASELYLYNRMPGSVWGAQNEFLSAPRLDDLQCAFASLKGFLQAEICDSVPVHCVYDNEEVGSATRQGAASTFLYDVLRRVNGALGGGEEDYLRALAVSFMLSADNAHAVHPNYGAKSDPTNRPSLNRGVVVKYSGNQKYTTDAVAGAIFGELCRRANVPTQTFANRSDMQGGSTLGNISNTRVPLPTVDIGLAQLAMHSPYETAGALDTGYMIRAAKVFFESALETSGEGVYRLI